MASFARAAVGVAVAGVGAAAAAATLAGTPFRLAPGQRPWSALVRGTADGAVRGRVAVFLPGVDRRQSGVLWVETEGTEPTALAVAVDDGPAVLVPARPGVATALALPASRVPGARLTLAPAEAQPPPRLRTLQVQRQLGPARRAAAWAFGLTILAAVVLFAFRVPQAVPLALAGSGLIALVFTPAWLVAALPAPSALARLLPVAALLAVGLVSGLRRADAAARRRFLGDVALLAALVFGAAVRLWLLPSSGSWDTEYWKAWTQQATTHGVTQVYGGPESVPGGHFTAQLRGQEPLWQAPYRGRDFGIDYPPLAMAIWRVCAVIVTRFGGGLDPGEAENVAVKLPALAGDVASLVFLFWALRDRPRRALALAALYWALPVSWLNSAAQGFMDAAYAPLVGAALVTAGRGRAGAAGAWLAAACLVKPTAVVVAPALAVALWPVARGWVKAAAAGLAVALVVLLPFALAGTLDSLVVHVGRVFLQQRLSGGYANAWWLVGETARAARDGLTAWTTPAPFQRLDAVPFPARSLGTVALLLAIAWIVARLRQARGPHAMALGGAVLVFAYGVLAIGVHENHPHPLFLLLCATGLASARLRWVALGAGTTYVLNILMLSGLGRFHGNRHLALEPILPTLGGLRLALGIDAMLLLAAANVAFFAVLMTGLRNELELLPAPLAEAGDGSL